jgi:hypothetical protein
MDNALGDAVFWTERVQNGQRPPATWLPAFFALRRAVVAYAARHGTSIRAPELPRHPRIPRSANELEPPPRPVALAGGTQADLVDAVATAREFALLVRDDHSRYSVCRLPIATPNGEIACAPFEFPIITDPRNVAFARGDGEPSLAVWARAPLSTRGLVDLATRHIQLLGNGNPDARRDYWVASERSFALQIDSHGPKLLVGASGETTERAMPASLDVLSTDRALIATAGGLAVAWLDTRTHGVATLRAAAFDATGTVAREVQSIATSHEPRWTGTDRILLACSDPSGWGYVIAADGQNGQIFSSRDATHWSHAEPIAARFDTHTEVLCDASGLYLVRRDMASVESRRCTPERCGAAVHTPTVGSSSVTDVEGRLAIADTGGSESTARVRALSPEGILSVATIEPESPTARDVRLVARGATVALFVASAETHAFISRDSAARFVPPVVAQ